MRNTDEYATARRRAETKYFFLVHAAVYAAVMVLLIAINLVTSPGVLWFIWPMIGWGIAVAIHGVVAFLLVDKNIVIDALTERELNRTGVDGRKQGHDGLNT